MRSSVGYPTQQKTITVKLKKTFGRQQNIRVRSDVYPTLNLKAETIPQEMSV